MAREYSRFKSYRQLERGSISYSYSPFHGSTRLVRYHHFHSRHHRYRDKTLLQVTHSPHLRCKSRTPYVVRKYPSRLSVEIMIVMSIYRKLFRERHHMVRAYARSQGDHDSIRCEDCGEFGNSAACFKGEKIGRKYRLERQRRI